LSRKGDNVELSVEVADTGIGIKKEDVGKLFKNFTRLDEQKNRNIEGTGLGLSLTEKLVKLMGGEINVESEYGKGSTFSVKLSQKIVNEAPVGNFSDQYNEFVNQKKENTNVIDIHDASILVVDDVEMNIQVVKGMLKKTRANIDTAYSGEECLDKIAKSHYDIIFLDHMMPEMDGIETLERMRKQDNPNTDTPVIILTANAVVGAKEMYLEKGFADYLSKPIRRDDLIDMLCRYLPKTMVNVPSIENPEGNTDDNAVSIEAESETVHIGNPKNLEERFPMLDTKMGMNYCMNDEEFYVEIIETYVQNDKRQLIADAFAAENWKDYETYVHALKSTSLNIGAVELSEHAKALELAAKEGNYGYIRENHKKVFDEYSEMLNKIKENI
jgi:CheY-like chemotaxis protein/HPt (histidine-containing phosphotransfer) domain-containing protein